MIANRRKRGQFIIIAVLLVAIMIVSMGALMHNAITYYKHEPWEEYSTLIGDIEINTRKLVELSLASYTNSLESITIIETNLVKWQEDLVDAYPNRGITLASSGAQMINSLQTNTHTATSNAQAIFTLNVLSIVLEGYKFNILTSLTLSIKSVTTVDSNMTLVIVVVTSETEMPVTDLDETNFKVENATNIAVSARYDSVNVLEYGILHNGSINSAIEVCDQRGICVTVSQT
jgi:hypothetical protein